MPKQRLHSIGGAYGELQLVSSDQSDAILIDIQGHHIGVDGISRDDHGTVMLPRYAAVELRDLLTRVTQALPVDHELPDYRQTSLWGYRPRRAA